MKTALVAALVVGALVIGWLWIGSTGESTPITEPVAAPPDSNREGPSDHDFDPVSDDTVEVTARVLAVDRNSGVVVLEGGPETLHSELVMTAQGPDDRTIELRIIEVKGNQSIAKVTERLGDDDDWFAQGVLTRGRASRDSLREAASRDVRSKGTSRADK